jgi:peptide/nickel transport system permease protein
VTRFGVLTVAAIPTFWLALELQYILGAKLAIFPISGNLSRNFTVPRRTGSTMLDSLLSGQPAAFWDSLQHFLLPAAILMIPFAAALFRATRAEMISVLSREHITVARAKGVPTYRLMWRHAVPNAMGPSLTVIGVEFGTMVGAAVLVEAVFGLNGMGSYLTTAVGNKDTFAVLGGVLVIGVIVVTTSFVVDLLQLVRDPRIRSAQVGV